jgi:ATP-binding cassette subfamily B protein
MHRIAQEQEGLVRIFMQEALGSLMVIKAFGREADVQKHNEERMQEHRSARLRKNRFSNMCNIGFGAAMQGAYLFGLIACGWGILNGTMTYGTCTALLQLVGQVQSPLVSITGFLPKMIAALGSAERLMEAGNMADDGGEACAAYDAEEYYNAQFEGFKLENIVFSYEEDGQERRVYNDLNLHVMKGECVAVTGPSGCGKSTLLKLLMCLYEPESGQRLLLEKGGERPLNASDRGLFAYVPQGNHWMGGSIRQALTFGEEASMRDDAGLWRALDAACAKDFVAELEDGLDTQLGERGQGLSEGQLQRIAIARAVYSGRPILLLDECTSALDEKTEAWLVETLRSMTDKTIVLVTHRPRALTVCTKRVEMDEQKTKTA